VVVEEKVQEILVAATGVTALVPAARIKLPGDWQTLPRPYIVHGPVSVDPTQTHGGLVALRAWEFYQVSCFGAIYSDAKRIAVSVRAALADYVSTTGGWQLYFRSERRLEYEADVRVQQIAVEFDVWETL